MNDSRNQYVSPTKTEFVVMQGAYKWCLAEMQQPVKQGLRFGVCDQQHSDLTSTGTVFVTVTLKADVISDAKSEEWSKFQILVKQWREQRGVRSSISETVMLPAYQKIIGMGEAVVPFLLAQLRLEGDEPDQWFWALMAIAGENPVPEEDQGDFVKMSHAWQRWGEQRVYAW